MKRTRSPNMERSLDEWLEGAPQLTTDWDDLARCYHQCLVDLAALRFHPAGVDGSVPAAGLPWFMALFGRDSLITSYQALPFFPELARTTLRALASRQAEVDDAFRDAEPGKILHELRHDDTTYFHEHPQSPYYGAADSTLLFLIVLDEYERWTADGETVRALERPARAAIDWMRRSGDSNGDGYIDYRTRNPETGLANQCWKDSATSIVHPDGTLATLPRATCELQGYAYDARVRCARLARLHWADGRLADELEGEAAQLKSRFNDDFWDDDGAFFVLALDGEGQQVATLASNMGQLLWSGIVDDAKVDDVVELLMGDALFSGWGVRTMARGHKAYNPISYHNGTVWPHDNSLIAMGLRRYGRLSESTRIGEAFIDATASFGYRLPEVFAGYERAASRFPVRYPTACSPQAWASGAPLLFLRAMLGLDPAKDWAAGDACLPGTVNHLSLRGIAGMHPSDVEVTAGR